MPISLLQSYPSLLHGGDAFVGELEGILGNELGLVLSEIKFERGTPNAVNLHIGQEPPAQQIITTLDLQVILVDEQTDRNPAALACGCAQFTPKLHYSLTPPWPLGGPSHSTLTDPLDRVNAKNQILV
jgi:hypothetical protein